MRSLCILCGVLLFRRVVPIDMVLCNLVLGNEKEHLVFFNFQNRNRTVSDE